MVDLDDSLFVARPLVQFQKITTKWDVLYKRECKKTGEP